MAQSAHDRMNNFHALADALLALAPAGMLTKEQRKGYVVLERKLSKSDKNKNAVSCIREGVSFMVPDWTMKSEAESERLQFEESKRYRRLVFPDLTPSQIEVSRSFFTRLVNVSIKEAESLQSGKSH